MVIRSEGKGQRTRGKGKDEGLNRVLEQDLCSVRSPEARFLLEEEGFFLGGVRCFRLFPFAFRLPRYVWDPDGGYLFERCAW